MLTTYGPLLRLPGVLRLFVVGFLARIPTAMAGVILTLHVVAQLDRGYGQAGVVAGALTIGIAIGAPWRGRLVDRLGLRRAILPSIVVESVAWLVMPHLRYEAVIAAAFVAGLFLVPVFSVTRQSLAILVPLRHQRSAFALDSVFTEITWMLAPVVGVLLATRSTVLGLSVIGVLTVAGGALLMWANPPTRTAPADGPAQPAAPRGRLVSPQLVVVLLAGLAAAFVLVGTDVSLVATLNEAGHAEAIGWMIALWAAGSVVGGLVHGARAGTPSPLVLVVLLAAATLPAAFAPFPVWLALAIFVAGLPCAPTLASINATLARTAPEDRRGEVIGWSGTMQTVGNALGAPLCGWVIDRSVPGAGFVTAAVVGGGIAVAGLVALRVVVPLARRRRRTAGDPVTSAPTAPTATVPTPKAPVDAAAVSVPAEPVGQLTGPV